MVEIFKERAFEGRVVFVAGASSGINLGIAHAFGAQGAKLAIISRSHEKIQAAAQGLLDAGYEAFGVAADVRDFDGVDKALARCREELGEIDVVISGAAGNFVAPALGMSANGFKTVIDIDLIGTFNVLRASFPYLRKPGASLISITAPQAKRPSMFQAHVCAAKAGINMLTQCLAMEWGPAGVRVNAISPGPIAGTEGVERLAPTDEDKRRWTQITPLRRFGSPENIGEAAAYLSSPAGAYVTGTILECDGGMHLGDASADFLSIPTRK